MSKSRVLRGGAFFSNARSVRCASRGRGIPYYSNFSVGFRVVFTKKEYAGLRGGSWVYGRWTLSSSSRNWYDPDERNYNVGFRLAKRKDKK